MRTRLLLWLAERNGLFRQPGPARRVARARRAVELLRHPAGAGNASGTSIVDRRRLVRGLSILASTLLTAGRRDEAEVAAREALALIPEGDGALAADAQHQLAIVLYDQGRLAEAETAAAAAVAGYWARVPGPVNGRRVPSRLVHALYTQSLILTRLDRDDEALAAVEESVRLVGAMSLPRRFGVLRVHWRAQCHLVGQLFLAGRYAEAVKVGDEVRGVADLLTRFYPSYAGPIRERLLTNLAQCQSRLERLDEAGRLAAEAVAGYRTLGEEYQPSLAWALEILADQHSAAGLADEADAARAEAARIYAELARTEPDPYREHQRRVHDARVSALWTGGGREAALDLDSAFLPVLRAYATADPAAFVPSLVDSLSVLAVRSAMVGRDGAVDYVDEAVEIARALDNKPDRDEPELLGWCLHARALVLKTARVAGRPQAVDDDAARSAEAAVRAWRRAVAAPVSRAVAGPRSHAVAKNTVGPEVELARSLDLAGWWQEVLGYEEDALQRREEAAGILRRHPEAPRARLVSVLHDLALSYSSAHRHREAIDVMSESIDLRRAGPGGSPVDQVNLGRALRQRSFDRNAIRRYSDARTDIDEAIEIFRRLAEESPAEYGPEVTRTEAQAARQSEDKPGEAPSD